MINKDSNIREVYDFLEKNRKEMSSHNMKELIQWKKLLRQTNGRAESMIYEFKIAGTTCYSVRYINKNRFYYSNIIAVPCGYERYQYIHWMTSTVSAVKYTSHFFDRYKERMVLDGSIKQVLKQFFKKSQAMACIYRMDGRVVYTTDEGLVLGIEDETLGMRVACTFVNYTLLKDNQRDAFDKIHLVTDTILHEHAELTGRGLNHWDATDVVTEEYQDVRQAAEDIYSRYFEEGDPKAKTF